MFRYYEDVFTDEVYDNINNESTEAWESPNLRASWSWWPHDVVNDSNNILIYECPEDSYTFKLFNQVVNNYFNTQTKEILFYYWLPGSHIPWHNDSHRKAAISYYLNETWQRDWGGLFLCMPTFKDKLDNNQHHIDIQAYTPLRNSMIIQDEQIAHAVSCTTQLSPIRRSVQVFI